MLVLAEVLAGISSGKKRSGLIMIPFRQWPGGTEKSHENSRPSMDSNENFEHKSVISKAVCLVPDSSEDKPSHADKTRE